MLASAPTQAPAGETVRLLRCVRVADASRLAAQAGENRDTAEATTGIEPVYTALQAHRAVRFWLY